MSKGEAGVIRLMDSTPFPRRARRAQACRSPRDHTRVAGCIVRPRSQMPAVEIGSEQFTDEDRLCAGSRFRDVVRALFANPYQKVWGRVGEPPLPVVEQTIATVFGGLFTIAKPPRFEGASSR